MKPTKLGQPCWEVENVALAITQVAKVDSSSVDYFLSSHSPIDGIVRDDNQQRFTEETLFQELTSSSHGQVLALIHGDPGTGKSHIIHWLKLRCEDALHREELSDIVPVLVQRRSGSLKDALEQIVQQLPPGFDQYLARIRTALGRIGEQTSRLKLAKELFLELSAEQRRTRNKPAIPRELRDLPEIFESEDFRDYLCRDDGPIDRNIKRLNQGSEVEDRLNFPEFTGEDFSVPPRFKAQVTPRVRNLIDELEDDGDLREQSAEIVNSALPDALRTMTGLSDAGLREIFDGIRADLKSQGKELYLFIEDISVMSALDEEVFVAVEPQPRGDLCKMVAVLGLTDQGWQKLPDNQKQRVTHPLSVSGKGTEAWLQSSDQIAEFTARYLNTVRLTPDRVSEITRQRRLGNGTIDSACNDCPVKAECHKTFGFVRIDSVEVGLFPFNNLSPSRLLNSLSDTATTRKNPRGLLVSILTPILKEGHEQLQIGNFPKLNIAVTWKEPTYWGQFNNDYCGNWSNDDKTRVRRYLQGWTLATNKDVAAQEVKSVLEALKFPPLSKAVLEANDRPVVEPGPPPKVNPVDNNRLSVMLDNLRTWHDGGSLVGDAEVRRLLVKFFKNSLPWDIEHFPPLDVWRSFFQDLKIAAAIYKIEGMVSRPANVNFYIDLPRNDENYNLFLALVHYEYQGGGSWNFEGADIHRRSMFLWIRRNAARVMQSLQPPKPLNIEMPIRRAVQTLALAAVIRNRSQLSSDPQASHALVRSLLEEFPDSNPPVVLSKQMNAILSDLIQRHRELKRFLVNELASTQGRSGTAIFIDPRPILKTAKNFDREFTIYELSPDYFKSYHRRRYQALDLPKSYSGLDQALQHEINALRERIDDIKFQFRSLGIDISEIRSAVSDFCDLARDIHAVAKRCDVHVQDGFFEDLMRQNSFTNRKEVWANAVERAESAQNETKPIKVLAFDPTRFMEFHKAVTTAVNYFSKVELETDKILNGIETSGDPDSILAELDANLERIKNAVAAGIDQKEGVN